MLVTPKRIFDILRRVRSEIRQTSLDVGQIKEALSLTWMPPGHFYSPIVNPAEVQRRRERIFDRSRDPVGVDLNIAGQMAMLRRLGRHQGKIPFKEERQDDIRYYSNNPNFSSGDAIILASMLMELRPKRVVEIGSGFSSCVTLDVDELFLGTSTEIVFVEPYPDLLRSLMKPGDAGRCTIVHSAVQDTDLSLFEQLHPEDILFIDSTHVSKCGSDVNFELFEILPRLKAGVYVHFHDVFHPFEYPEDWIFTENRSWNELYVLRAFLTNNPEYEIIYFNHYMHLRHRDVVEGEMPSVAEDCGSGLWLRKTGLR